LGAPSIMARFKASLLKSTLSFFPSAGLTAHATRNLRASYHDGLALSPRMGRRPIWPFSPTFTSSLFQA
jgi:hypothetical protein